MSNEPTIVIRQHDKPPNYERIRAVFDVRPTTIFTYGNTIYVPGGGELDYPLRMHERTHVLQQAAFPGGPEMWWNRYLDDPAFRLEQELEAYRNQYRAMSRSERERNIRRIAGDLSSPLYGNVVTFDEAKMLIRNGLK